MKKSISPKKRIVIFIAITISIMVIAGFIITILFNNKDQNQNNDNNTNSLESENLSSSNKKKKFDINKSSDASKALEKHTRISGDRSDKAIKSLEIALKYINSVKLESDIKINYENHLSITDIYTAKMVNLIMRSGYVFNKSDIKIYKSKTSNVYQFIVVLKKPSDSSEVSLVGNYVTGTDQIEIKSIFGTPTGLANS